MHEIEASEILNQQREKLAEHIVERQYNLQKKLWKPYKEAGWEKSVRDAGYHLAYLSEALAVADASLFIDYVGWVKVLFAGLNFPEDVLETTLTCICDVAQEKLSAEHAKMICDYVNIGIQHLDSAPTTLGTYLKDDEPLTDLAKQYLDALLAGKRHIASQLILDAVHNQVAIKDIYLYVFQRVQREVGRLWQMNHVSVAQEHYCTAATQLIMSQLYPYIFATDKQGGQLVATCVGGELHELGVRMVADFFEMEGWDTYYLGANTPASSILQTLEAHKADVLAISATITVHVRRVAQLIESVRETDVGQRTKILVGGYPFNVAPNLWKDIGADGYAPDAEGAIAIANQWKQAGD